MRLYKFKALALSITILIGTWLNTIRHMCTMSKVSHKKNNINKEKNLVWTIFHFLFSYNKSMKIILYQKKKKKVNSNFCANIILSGTITLSHKTHG